MIKKVFIIFIISIILYPSFIVLGEENLISNAKAGLLMETSTGTIIYEKNIL